MVCASPRCAGIKASPLIANAIKRNLLIDSAFRFVSLFSFAGTGPPARDCLDAVGLAPLYMRESNMGDYEVAQGQKKQHRERNGRRKASSLYGVVNRAAL